MEKQLPPLEAFRELKTYLEDVLFGTRESKAFGYSSTSQYLMPFIEQVETALKEKDKQNDYYAKLLESVLNDKEHKALEIIKEKNVNTFLVRQCKNYIEYNRALANQGVVGARHFNLTKEEFDLLKEILK